MPITIAPNYTQRHYKWSDWKTVKSVKNFIHQYEDDSVVYTVWGYDGPEVHLCTIWKSEVPSAVIETGYSQNQNNIDKTDFEDNYKTAANKALEIKDSSGRSSIAPTFEDAQGLTTVWKSHLYTAQPNSLNIFDEVVTTQLKLRGGWYRLLDNNATVGDYVEFAIVDKDNVLGLFGYFGLTVGQDVLELKKFVRTDYVSPESKARQEFQSAGASEVMTGLYFRSYYYNSGNSTVQFTVTEKYHET